MKRILLVMSLAACAAKPEIRYVAMQCPAVPQCIRPELTLNTNEDLAKAYLATGGAFEQCKIARDTLAACIEGVKK